MYELTHFEDPEKELVRCLKIALEQLNISARVATQRLPENQRNKNTDEVIIRCIDSSIVDNHVTLESDFNIYVFCMDDNENVAYKKANDLTRWVMTSLRSVVANSNIFRSHSGVSSSPFEDDGLTQVRQIIATFTSYGSRTRIK